jgi:peptidylprolyl isomerase
MIKQTLWVLFISSTLMLAGCTSSTPSSNANEVASGDTIAVWYIGTESNGTMFDTNVRDAAQEWGLYNAEFDNCEGDDLSMCKYKPLEFTVWAWQMIPWFDAGVVGMTVGETKTLTIPSVDAYGAPSSELIQKVPSTIFDESGITPELWERYNFGFAAGIITEITADELTIDFNPPLAGKDLVFEVTIESVTKGTPVKNTTTNDSPASDMVNNLDGMIE